MIGDLTYSKRLEYPYNLIAAIRGEPIDYILTKDQIKGIEWIKENALKEREKQMIDLYFTHDDMTLEKVGKVVGLTRERVRQILVRAIRRMAQPHYSKMIFNGYHSSEEIAEASAKIQFREQYLDEWESKLHAERYDLNKKLEMLKNVKDIYNIPDTVFECETVQELRDSHILWDEDIEVLDLSVRSYNCLHRKDIYTVNDLVDFIQKYGVKSLWNIRNLGARSYKEIIEKIEKYTGLIFERS